MNHASSGRGRAVLMLAHFAGMIDLVALPVWVGALVQHYRFDLEHAGMVVTAFLLGAVVASLLAAPRFNILPHRLLAMGGYAGAAVAFACASQVSDFAVLLPLHALAGLCLGTGLSMVHGAIGRSANPHRLFAMAGAALGVGAVVFYGAVPPAIAAGGGQTLFFVFAGLMAVTAAACSAFPHIATDPQHAQRHAPLSRVAWLAVLGVTCMALNQSITFAMLDRVGVMRGFGQERVNMVLLVCGFVNLLPAVLAGLLQQRLSATRVALIAPLVQATLAVIIASSPTFEPYALAASVFAAVMIFTHTFLFGLIARLDPSGRAVASTPAMMMTGAAIGPALAGSVAMRAGFDGLAVLAVVVGIAATCAFAYVSRHGRSAAGTPLAVVK
ncbi:MFS transporter [Duganella sp. BuS-21]|uniref:MFS transporter n=1 Tax=Duganella sp. BuS-21 TaxID=2943848 RepID=UPI0035A575C5